MSETLEVEVGIYCECGQPLDTSLIRGTTDIEVTMCATCLETKEREAHDKGYEAGYEAHQQGVA